MNEQHLIYGNQSEPANQFGAMVNLAYIVNSLKNNTEEYSMVNYHRMLQIVIEGVRHLRLYGQASIQVGYFKLNEAGIIKFPPDYIDYTVIGVPCHGMIVTLSVNNRMLLNRAQVCGEDIRVMNKSNGLGFTGMQDGYYLSPFYGPSGYVGALYSVGGGFNTAYFRIDKTAQQIEFDGIIRQISDGQMIVMEYASTGISPGTVVGAEMIEPLKEWLAWKMIDYDPRVALSQKEMRKSRFEDSVRSLRAFNNKFTISEFKDCMYRNMRQGPKPIV